MAANAITIRDYRAADSAVTLELYQRAIREVACRDYGPEQVEEWSQIDDMDGWAQARASRPTWIAECAGVPAGFADLMADGCLDMLFVSPDFQGIGVASQLLIRVEATARQQGLDTIHTLASLTAQPFFRRRGFSTVLNERIESRGQWFDLARMTKALR